MEIVGLIPAGGQARRLQPLPCSKELMPIGFRQMPDGSKKPKVVAQVLLDKYAAAGASKVFFVLRDGKWDIPQYFGNGKNYRMDFAYLLMDEPHGVPYTIDQAYSFINRRKVLLGFPDILFEPKDAYSRLDSVQFGTGADLVVGGFELSSKEQAAKCDMIDFDNDGNLTDIVIKPKSTNLTYSWIIALWTPVFTEFMHGFLKKELEDREEGSKEIYLGEVFKEAIKAGLTIKTCLFPNETFKDIGTSNELSEAWKGHDY
ncbi:sugar phosphate nucleotidyltransferase [Flammeovirgaceae bacterium SG7u.111]|nr:sugar phosphate nucleotidyltransferase [Flammeovirgaceae bacterium SG7u.132]WPO36798.1 sugar phosphate nucleotidyltransferase [Flammeovirgaceae bacterium SG7u.111]